MTLERLTRQQHRILHQDRLRIVETPSLVVHLNVFSQRSIHSLPICVSLGETGSNFLVQHSVVTKVLDGVQLLVTDPGSDSEHTHREIMAASVSTGSVVRKNESGTNTEGGSGAKDGFDRKVWNREKRKCYYQG